MWVSIIYEVGPTYYQGSNFKVYTPNSDFIIYWMEKGRMNKYFYWEKIFYFSYIFPTETEMY